MQPILFKVEIENGKFKINYNGGVSRNWEAKEVREFFREWIKEHNKPN